MLGHDKKTYQDLIKILEDNPFLYRISRPHSMEAYLDFMLVDNSNEEVAELRLQLLQALLKAAQNTVKVSDDANLQAQLNGSLELVLSKEEMVSADGRGLSVENARKIEKILMDTKAVAESKQWPIFDGVRRLLSNLFSSLGLSERLSSAEKSVNQQHLNTEQSLSGEIIRQTTNTPFVSVGAKETANKPKQDDELPPDSDPFVDFYNSFFHEPPPLSSKGNEAYQAWTQKRFEQAVQKFEEQRGVKETRSLEEVQAVVDAKNAKRPGLS